MKKIPATKSLYLFAVSSILLFSLQTQAQEGDAQNFRDIAKSSALSLQLGGNTFLGDLGGTKGKGKPFAKDFDFKTVRLFTGLSYTYFFDKAFSLNAELHITSINGADSLIKDKVGHSLGRFERNLSFKSSLYEFQVTAELYPLQALSDKSSSRFMPYIGTGVGFFHFNPQTKLNGEWYYLHPLHLEGQGFAEYPDRKGYKLTQLYLPLSLGIKYRIDENNIIGLNAIFRKTFTDYIDDVSTNYIDPALFDKYIPGFTASVAKQLYYRGISPQAPKPGTIRGYSGNDSYTSVFFSFTHLLNSGE